MIIARRERRLRPKKMLGGSEYNSCGERMGTARISSGVGFLRMSWRARLRPSRVEIEGTGSAGASPSMSGSRAAWRADLRVRRGSAGASPPDCQDGNRSADKWRPYAGSTVLGTRAQKRRLPRTNIVLHIPSVLFFLSIPGIQGRPLEPATVALRYRITDPKDGGLPATQ